MRHVVWMLAPTLTACAPTPAAQTELAAELGMPPPGCPTSPDAAGVAACLAGPWAALSGGQGFASISDALLATAPGDTVVVCPGIHPGTVVVDRAVTVQAADPRRGRTVIDGEAHRLAVQVTEPATLRGLTVGRGRANRGAGALVEAAGVTLECMTFAHNVATVGGGGVSARVGDITVRGSTFFRNRGGLQGGAVETGPSGLLAVEDSRFLDNQARTGGAIMTMSDATLTGTTFIGNSAYTGGAVDFSTPHMDRKLAIYDSLFRSNTATYEAGALNLGGGNRDRVDIVRSTIERSRCGYVYGASAIAAGGSSTLDLTIEDSVIRDNGDGDGAALAMTNWTGSVVVAFIDTQFLDNVGGAIDTYRPFGLGVFTQATASGLVVWRNSAPWGALMMTPGDTFDCTACDFGTGADDNAPMDAVQGGLSFPSLPATFTL